MNLRTLFAVALLVLGTASSALCSTLQVTASGVFGDNLFASRSPYQSPYGTFSYSFLTDSTPTVLSAIPGYLSNLQIQDLQYTLNGNKVTTTSDAYVTLSIYSSTLYLHLTGDVISDTIRLIPDAQLYSGGVGAPTILPGSYTTTYGNFGGSNPLASSSNINITTVGSAAVTPEPSSILLLGTGVLGIAGVLRRKLA